MLLTRVMVRSSVADTGGGQVCVLLTRVMVRSSVADTSNGQV